MAMTPKENALAIFERRQPERYVDLMHAIELVPDPVFVADQPAQDGLEHLDTWGTVHIARPGEPGQMPIVNEDNAVIKDVTNWRDQLVVPDLEHLDWTEAEQFTAGVDRTEKFVGSFCPAGLFERCHYLMGFEEALVNFMPVSYTHLDVYKRQACRRWRSSSPSSAHSMCGWSGCCAWTTRRSSRRTRGAPAI